MSRHDIEDCPCSACSFIRHPYRNQMGAIDLVGAQTAYDILCESGDAQAIAVLTLAMAQCPNDPAGVLKCLQKHQREILASWEDLPPGWQPLEEAHDAGCESGNCNKCQRDNDVAQLEAEAEVGRTLMECERIGNNTTGTFPPFAYQQACDAHQSARRKLLARSASR